MHAVVAGFDHIWGYLFKCPICGKILSEQQSFCTNCNSQIEYVKADEMFRTADVPKVCIDLHGVAVDMLGALRLYLKENRGVNFDPASVTDYDFQCDIGFDRKLIFEAFKDVELHKLVMPYRGAEDAIRILKAHCNVHAYSGVVDDPDVVALTATMIHNLGMLGKPLAYRKPIIFDANVLFDDCPAVHRQWQKAGFKGLQYMVDHPYNRAANLRQPDDIDWMRIIRVNSLYEGVMDMCTRYDWLVPEVSFDG